MGMLTPICASPVYILYSSGTTGKPKCIVHGAIGTLIQHKKEHDIQCDIRPGDRLFYFSKSCSRSFFALMKLFFGSQDMLREQATPKAGRTTQIIS